MGSILVPWKELGALLQWLAACLPLFRKKENMDVALLNLVAQQTFGWTSGSAQPALQYTRGLCPSLSVNELLANICGSTRLVCAVRMESAVKDPGRA